MIKYFTFFILASMLPLAGCGKQKNIDENKLANVYISILFAEDSLSFAPDSLMNVKKNIFAKYKITEKEYIFQLDSFKDDKTEWQSFFDLATAKLDSMIAIADSAGGKLKKNKVNPKKFFSENQKSN